MKHSIFLKSYLTRLRGLTLTLIILSAFGIGNAWGASPWSHTFTSTSTNPISDESMTISSATWSVATVTGKGSPTTAIASYSQTYGLKFGSSKNAYFSKITLTTSYFTSYNVSSVTVNALLNANVSTTMTIKQGSTTIGSPNYSTANTWHNFTANTNSGSGGNLSIEITSSNAIYIHSFSVTYTTGGGSTYTVEYANSITGGSVQASSTSGISATTEITLTPNANNGYEFTSWDVYKKGESSTKVMVTNNKFSMPAYNVVVDATFSCKNPVFGTDLSTETINYSTSSSPTALTVAASANNATINYQWQKSSDNSNWSDEGTNSSSNTSLTPNVASAGTTYYRVIATNATSGCSSAQTTSNVATVVVTAPTPATITLNNYDGDATTTGYHSGDSFTLPNTNNATCNGKTFVGWSTVAIPTPGSKPNSNYYEKGASVTLGASNTFYAVFAESSGSGTTSSSITSYADGTYYLIDSFTDAESNTSYRSPTGTANNAKLSSVDLTTDVSVTNNVLTLDITSASLANAMKYTISRVYDSNYDKYYYRIYNATAEAYVEPNTGTNFKNTSTTPWEVLSENNRFMFWYDASTDRCFLYQDSYSNNSGTKTYGRQFGCYAKNGAGTITAQSGKECYGSGYFFLVPATAAATYSNYTTNCVNMRTIYLDAYHFGDSDGAKFAIYSWRNADASDNKLSDAFMTKVEDCYYGHLYEGEMPDNHDRVIFLRNAEAASVPVKSGANKLNQTSNITTEANKDFFTIASDGGGDSYTGSWSVYTPNYAVTFNKNGVTTTNTWPVDQCKTSGTAATNPNVTPLTMGKTFVGWYREAGGTNAWNFSNTITQDTILYAKWNDVATKTIYLDASADLPANPSAKKWDADNVVLFAHAYINGTSLATDIKAISPISSCQQHVYQFVIPGNADYVTFARCATGTTTIIWEGGSSNVYNQFSQPVQANKDLYTVTEWNAGSLQNSTFTPTSYTISFAAGDYGSGDAPANDSKACGVAFTLPSTQVFSRNGYTMDGWSINANGSTNDYNLGGSYTTEANQTFYPHWALVSYDITLNTNGGTINSGNVTSYTYETGATLPTDVTKSHATFQGWYAASNFSGDRVYSISTTEYGAKEYWAKWEDVTWTVTWKANGSTQTTSVVDGNTATAPTPNPANLATSPDGCVAEFVGWVIEANDPGPFSVDPPSSAPSGMFTTTSPAITGDVTFVAIYRQEQ